MAGILSLANAGRRLLRLWRGLDNFVIVDGGVELLGDSGVNMTHGCTW